MAYRFLLLVTLYISLQNIYVCRANLGPLPFEKPVREYFKSKDVLEFGLEWNKNYRRPIQQALAKAMQESFGSPGLNVYIRKRKEILATGYLHDDNQVRVILGDLNLEEMPKFQSSNIKFSLATNNLRLESFLTNMIIHADYALIRNKTSIIHDPKLQDPTKSSPFLFEQVQDVGKVAITVEGCRIKGIVLPTCQRDSIYLGYTNMDFFGCKHTIEIYTPGEDSPPVIAKYNLGKSASNPHLQIDRLLLKPLIEDDLIPKLQAAVFSFVNTSAMFGKALRAFREDQEIVHEIVANHFTTLVQNMNRVTSVKTHWMKLDDYAEYWNDGRVKPSKGHKPGETLNLTGLWLTGLNTIYSSHTGGPRVAGQEVVICEKLRFSSLQVLGELQVNSTWSDTFPFTADINDLTVDMEVILPANINKTKEQPKIEVDWLGRMTLTLPSLIFGSARSFIAGYLLSAVPKMIVKRVRVQYSDAIRDMKLNRTEKGNENTSNVTGDPSDNDDRTVDDMIDHQIEESGIQETHESGAEPGNLKGIGMDTDTSHHRDIQRYTFEKEKLMFKSMSHLRNRRLRSGKRLQKNLLRKK